MMDFECVASFFLSNPTSLTGVIIALACFSIALIPILAVVWKPTTAPSRAIFSIDKLGLPIAHAVTAAKVVPLYFGVLASKLLTAPIAVNRFTTPSKKNILTFLATCYLFGLFKSIWLDSKRFSADRAFKRWGGFILFSVFSLATPRAEIGFALTSLDLIIMLIYLFIAVEAIDVLSHTTIISYMIAHERRRWHQMTGRQPVLVE